MVPHIPREGQYNRVKVGDEVMVLHDYDMDSNDASRTRHTHLFALVVCGDIRTMALWVVHTLVCN